MSRRIDIELTSDKGDGTWTWRAAGAKQPKGTLDGSLLPQGAEVGQELRAEVEMALDGTEVTAVLPPKTKNRSQVETLELISRPVGDDELVTQKLAGKGKGKRRDRGERGDRDDRGRGRGRGGRDGERGRGRGDRERSGGDRGRGRGERSERPRRERPAPPSKPKPKRLRPARTHRKAALEALPAAEQVIGEQVLQGGLPAVRQAVQKQNEQAKAAGGREVAAEPLLAIAERLLPDLRAAEWLDRAEAAVADLDELDLRDLRSVVVAAESGAKGEEARALAQQLQTGLAARVEKEQAAWIQELTETLADDRTVRALRLSSRPPKAGAPLPPELAAKLAEAASEGLTADTHDDRWATVLDALSYSPVHLTVAPASKPEQPSEALVATVTKLASRVPKVAEAFGIEAPAQPARRRSRGGKGKKKPAPKAGAPAPAPPTAAEAPTGEPPAPEAEANEPTPTTETPATETPATETPATETPATDAAAPETTPEPRPEAATEEVAEAQEAAPQEATQQEAPTEAPTEASTPTGAPGDAEGGPETAEQPPA